MSCLEAAAEAASFFCFAGLKQTNAWRPNVLHWQRPARPRASKRIVTIGPGNFLQTNSVFDNFVFG
jgi:hypothetical protein